MADYNNADDAGIFDHRFCTLVDRAATGGVEFPYSGRHYIWPKGQVELNVPQSVAAFLCNPANTKTQVWTMDGRQICRLAVRGASPDLLAALGPDAADETPIEIDPTVSNILGERFEPAVLRQSQNRTRAGQRDHQGGGVSRVAAGTGV